MHISGPSPSSDPAEPTQHVRAQSGNQRRNSYPLEVETSQAVTLAFLTYGFARLWHAFNMRSPDTDPLHNDMTTSPHIWGAITLCAVLLGTAVYQPSLATILQLTPPSPSEWAIVLLGSLIPLLLGQIAIAWVAQPTNEDRRP